MEKRTLKAKTKQKNHFTLVVKTSFLSMPLCQKYKRGVWISVKYAKENHEKPKDVIKIT